MTYAANGLEIIGGATITNHLQVSGTTGMADVLTVSANASVTGPLGISLGGTQPAKTADPGGPNLALGVNQCKAWGKVTTNNTATSTLDDGYNVMSVVNNSDVLGVVNFARSMMNANYSVVITSENSNAYAVVTAGGKNVAYFQFTLYKTSDFSAQWPLNVTGHEFDFQVFARQI